MTTGQHHSSAPAPPDSLNGACYLTTPIYYVNDRPHIGHCYTTLLGDVVARFQRLVRGSDLAPPGEPGPNAAPRDVFFLTGTDEHADKVVTSAAAHNATPQQWADQNAAEFIKAFQFMNVSNDDFIRTSQPRHKERVTAYISALLASGAVYRGEYTGWYDEGQEEYVTETAARENDFKSTVSRKPLVKRTEPCYFFRLGQYQERLRDLIERDVFRVAPDARKSEVLGRLKPPAVLNDVPISRPVTADPATQWGIRIPGDDANRVYVWIDALFNYLSVVDTPERRRFWPAFAHLIGKDILWFHAVIWPALLLALRESGPKFEWVGLPRNVFGHGWWVSEGQKMSKSLGNFIDIDTLRAYAAWTPTGHAEPLGVDALRWYLTTQGPLSGSDADFAHAKFAEVYNNELANGFGNCASRIGSMIAKYFGGELPAAEHDGVFTVGGAGTGPLDLALAARAAAKKPVDAAVADRAFDFPSQLGRIVAESAAAMDALQIDAAVLKGIQIVRFVDEFISHTAPFTLAKQAEADPRVKDALKAILSACAEALRVASLLLYPALPNKMAEFWRRWGCTPPTGVGLLELATFGGRHALRTGTKLEVAAPLFMRIDPAEKLPA